MSELRTNRIVPRDGLPSGSAGGIIQVRSTTKTDAFNMPSNDTNFHTVTGLSVTITPTRSDSKILVMYDMNWVPINGHASCRLMRDSTPIKIGDASGIKTQVTGQVYFTTGDQYDLENLSGTFLDSPATTSAVTYKIKGLNMEGSTTLYINRRGSNDTYSLTSFLTVMEVTG